MKSSLSQADESKYYIIIINDENLTLLQRQESNLLPLDYETNMQPLTPRCDDFLKDLHILADLEAENNHKPK